VSVFDDIVGHVVDHVHLATTEGNPQRSMLSVDKAGFTASAWQEQVPTRHSKISAYGIY
jgi:hypothetical protein